MTGSASTAPWYVVSTRPRHENVVREQLQQKDIEVFLPTVTRWSRWKDRRKQIAWPLFPGYCFARFPAQNPLPVLKCSGVVRILTTEGRLAPVANEEIEQLRTVVANTDSCDPCPVFREGMLVRIANGPLRGVVGRLLLKDFTHATVVLSLDIINQAVRVQVHAADIVAA